MWSFGIEHARREHDVHVRGVVGRGGDETAGAPDARALEHGVVGGITLETEPSPLLGVAHVGFRWVHDEKRHAGLGQLLPGLPADAAETGQDDVPAERLDTLVHLASPRGIGQPQRDDVLHHHAEGVEEAADSDDRDDHREDAAGRVERLDLAVADRRDRRHRHEERVEPRAADLAPEPEVADASRRRRPWRPGTAAGRGAPGVSGCPRCSTSRERCPPRPCPTPRPRAATAPRRDDRTRSVRARPPGATASPRGIARPRRGSAGRSGSRLAHVQRLRLDLIAAAGREVGPARVKGAAGGPAVRMREGALDDGQPRACLLKSGL